MSVLSEPPPRASGAKMAGTLAAFALGLALLPTVGVADSKNAQLACVKELPNPMSLAGRIDYVLTCTTRQADLTVTKIVANRGDCDCRVLKPTTNMKPNTRFMSVCRKAKTPCDFTEIEFETNSGDFVFTWDPDEDEPELR